MPIRWPDPHLPPINQRVLPDALSFSRMLQKGKSMNSAERTPWPHDERMEHVGQNGNEGLHYDQIRPLADEAPRGPFAEYLSAPWFLEQGLLHMEDRASTYDKQELGGERSMQACVDAFIAVTGDGLVNTAERGWLFMVLLKMTRSQQGQFKSDNYEDATAYCGLMGESAAAERA